MCIQGVGVTESPKPPNGQQAVARLQELPVAMAAYSRCVLVCRKYEACWMLH